MDNPFQAIQPPQGPPDQIYEAPTLLVKGFYFLVGIWSIVCIIFLLLIFKHMALGPLYGLFMIAFILVFMWYFSLAFAYRLEVWQDGTLRMTSYRRTIMAQAQDIPKAMGPRFPVGFLKFRLEREMGYVFYQAENQDLQKALRLIKDVNPYIQFTNI
ncbi:MAG: hypothetical protein K9J81_08595 [Desulfohalobiaceae bacterium]|nr:hypothetical protein [Desulfohalobiaceae bacterium]